MEKRFGSTIPYTVGLEEEFQLVDPSTRELAPAIEAVLDALPSRSELMAPRAFPRLRRDAHASVLERREVDQGSVRGSERGCEGGE